MRIAIDARELHGKPTGVGRYLSEILAAWKTLPAAAAHDFILCAPGPQQGRGTFWEQLTLRDSFSTPAPTSSSRLAIPDRSSRLFPTSSLFTTCRLPRILSGSGGRKACAAGR